MLESLLEACAGRPLGLTELPLVLTEAQRSGEEPLPTPLEAGPLVQPAFAARASGLGAEARRALLLLAAGGEVDVALLLPAGVDAETLDAMQSSGLVVERLGTLVFSHPLAQSAIYGAAAPAERREAHRTLAETSDGARRAWRLAGAAAGPDESVAEALEAAAADARLTGGRAAEAQALERAAALTTDDNRRAQRMRAAAQAWLRAGRVEHAQALLEHALPLARELRTRAGSSSREAACSSANTRWTRRTISCSSRLIA